MIDRSSPIPLYIQLKEILLEKIRQHNWQPGELIPSETALEDIYGLSRITNRQALSELVNEGYLNRQRGRGTFVTTPKFTHDPAKRLTLTDTMLEQGVTPGWRVLRSSWLEASREIGEKLGLPAGSQVFCLERLRLADDKAIGYHVAFLPETIHPHIETTHFDEGGSLHYLCSVPGIGSSKADRILEALRADDDIAGKLGIAVGSPILRIQRSILAHDGRPLEFMQASYRGDRFKYHIAI